MVTKPELAELLDLTSAATGSIGPFTVSRNAQGPFIRDRVSPAQPGSIKKTQAQVTWKFTAKRWHDQLTEDQRDGWKAYAFNVPMVDRLGAVRRLTGFQHFVRSNQLRRYVQIPPRHNAPKVFNLGEWTETPPTVKSSPTRATIQLSWDTNDHFAGEAGCQIHLFATVAYSPSVLSFRPPCNHVGFASAVMWPPKQFPMRSAANIGDHVFAEVQINRYDGRLSYRSRFAITVLT